MPVRWTLQTQRSDGGENGCRVVPLVGREYVDVQLDLVAVGVGDVKRVGDGVVASASDRDSVDGEVRDHLTQIVVVVAHVQPEVIEAKPSPFGDGRSRRSDFDEEKLVVGSPGRERGSRNTQGDIPGDLVPAEDFAVKVPGSFQILDLEHDVAELADLHRVVPSLRVA